MVIIRPYRKEDEEFCKELLITEGIPEEEQIFKTNLTWIMEDGIPIGFFTLVQGEFMQLQHFGVRRGKRSIERARMMVKTIKKIVAECGLTQLLIKVQKKYLQRMIEYYFKTSPVFRNGYENTYLVKF